MTVLYDELCEFLKQHEGHPLDITFVGVPVATCNDCSTGIAAGVTTDEGRDAAFEAHHKRLARVLLLENPAAAEVWS